MQASLEYIIYLEYNIVYAYPTSFKIQNVKGVLTPT